MKAILIALFVAVLGVAGLALYKSTTLPDHVYYRTGTFAGCPQRPSCVSSQASDSEHRVEPLRAQGEVTEIATRLRETVLSMGGEVVAAQAGYLHALFKTPTMRYRDDLELLVREDGTVDVRSISRFGYRDFGVNRARVEDLRARFEAAS